MKIRMPAPDKAVFGVVSVVQEQRFRLLTDDGRGFLLTLAHSANIDDAELCRLRDAHMHVRVRYGGEANTDSGIAQWIEPMTA